MRAAARPCGGGPRRSGCKPLQGSDRPPPCSQAGRMKKRDCQEVWWIIAMALCMLAPVGFTVWGWIERLS